MAYSSLSAEPLFHVGMAPISAPVVVTWFIIAACWAASVLIVRGFAPPSPCVPISALQAAMELFAGAIDRQIRDAMQVEPGRYRALIGALFLYILAANWSALIPGVKAPTAYVETDAALALVVLCATAFFGIRERGLKAYLATFAEPNWVMIPLNLVEQIARGFASAALLLGNVKRGICIVGIALLLAVLLAPVPLMALDLLAGAVRAYIFTVLAMVFIGAAVTDGDPAPIHHQAETP